MKNSSVDKILDAAEQLFALGNYDSVALRQIADLAGVRQGLLHYHFGSKEGLYSEVIKRRVNILKEHRLALLNNYLAETNQAPLSIEKIVKAFISPYLYLTLNGGDNWKYYSKLVAGLLGNNLKMLSEHFTETSHIFIHELRRSMPMVSEKNVQWGYDFMVGLMCNTFAEVDRINLLSDGLCSTQNIQQACEKLVPFITAGLLSLKNDDIHTFDKSFEILTDYNSKL